MSDEDLPYRLAAAESALLSPTEATAAATATAEEAQAEAAKAVAEAWEAHAACVAAAQSSFAWRARALAWQTWWEHVTERELLQEFAHRARDAPEEPGGGAGAAAGAAAGGGAAAQTRNPAGRGERGALEQPTGSMDNALDYEALAVEDEYYRQLAMLCGAPAEPHPEPLGEDDAA